jgi:adenosylmethionine-8-amino-7-oxononanoate aminotransferase
VLERVARIEQQLRTGLEPLRSLPHVTDVRVIGGVGVVELGGDGYLDGMGPKLGAEFVRRGVLLRPLGNIVYFMPPYVISHEETAWVLEQIREVLSDRL